MQSKLLHLQQQMFQQQEKERMEHISKNYVVYGEKTKKRKQKFKNAEYWNTVNANVNTIQYYNSLFDKAARYNILNTVTGRSYSNRPIPALKIDSNKVADKQEIVIAMNKYFSSFGVVGINWSHQTLAKVSQNRLLPW